MNLNSNHITFYHMRAAYDIRINLVFLIEISSSLTHKERYAARLWKQKWSFYTQQRQIQEEEALKLGKSNTLRVCQRPIFEAESNAVRAGRCMLLCVSGACWNFFDKIQRMSMEEYRAGVRSMNCQSEPRQYPVEVDPSPAPLPPTSSGMVGRRALCPLERYGRLVKTARDYPTRPPLPPGQVYDPYKQTIIFLGIDVGDPISYKLPPARCEVTDELWARPQTVTVDPLIDGLSKTLHDLER